jgi:hypothetical protein
LHGLDEMEASIALQLEDAKGQTQPDSKKGGRQPTCKCILRYISSRCKDYFFI